jgi:hypothetical protein
MHGEYCFGTIAPASRQLPAVVLPDLKLAGWMDTPNKWPGTPPTKYATTTLLAQPYPGLGISWPTPVHTRAAWSQGFCAGAGTVQAKREQLACCAHGAGDSAASSAAGRPGTGAGARCWGSPAPGTHLVARVVRLPRRRVPRRVHRRGTESPVSLHVRSSSASQPRLIQSPFAAGHAHARTGARGHQPYYRR